MMSAGHLGNLTPSVTITLAIITPVAADVFSNITK